MSFRVAVAKATFAAIMPMDGSKYPIRRTANELCQFNGALVPGGVVCPADAWYHQRPNPGRQIPSFYVFLFRPSGQVHRGQIESQ